MRTQGNFQKIFMQARHYLKNNVDDIPTDAVVRLEGSTWMIESRIEPANDNCLVEVDLEVFQNYWCESFFDGKFPCDDDVKDFIEAYQHEN